MAFISGLLGIIISVVIFLVFRGVFLWYWKIDKIEEHLAAIRRALDQQNMGISNNSSNAAGSKVQEGGFKRKVKGEIDHKPLPPID